MPDKLPAVQPDVKDREIPEEFVKEFMDFQKKELEVKYQQFELEKQQDNHSFEYAQKSLEAQARDRKESREHRCEMRRHCYLFSGIMVVILVIFLLLSLKMGKENVALEVIQALVFIASGGAGGYAIGKYKPKDSE